MTDGLILRKNIRNLSPDQLNNTRAAYRHFMSITDNRGYGFIADHHGATGFWCWHHQEFRQSNFGVRLFLPWHRRICIRSNKRYWMPRIQWELEKSDCLGGIGGPINLGRMVCQMPSAMNSISTKRHPLLAFHMDVPSAGIDRATRRFPMEPEDLTEENAVSDLLALGDLDDFNDELENVHDGIHGWVGGFKRNAQGNPSMKTMM